jgi:hypothetical protein
VDLALGPWTAAKTVEEKQRKLLAEAMGDEAWRLVKRSADFTPVKAEGKPAAKGFTISGDIVKVVKQGHEVQVVAKYTLWVDGTFPNIAPVEGRASATGSMGAEDALRAVTENRVKMLLDVIKSGRIQKAS